MEEYLRQIMPNMFAHVRVGIDILQQVDEKEPQRLEAMFNELVTLSGEGLICLNAAKVCSEYYAIGYCQFPYRQESSRLAVQAIRLFNKYSHIVLSKVRPGSLEMRMSNLIDQPPTSPLTVAEGEKVWLDGYRRVNTVALRSIHVKNECKAVCQLYMTYSRAAGARTVEKGLDYDVLKIALYPAKLFCANFTPVHMNGFVMAYQHTLYQADLGFVVARLRQTSNLDIQKASTNYRDSFSIAKIALRTLAVVTRMETENKGVKRLCAKNSIVEMACQYILRRRQQQRDPFLFIQYGESYSDSESEEATKRGPQAILKIDVNEIINSLENMPDTILESRSEDSDLSHRSDIEAPVSKSEQAELMTMLETAQTGLL